jgi:uncharacterized protein YndB with AHSA1/START domain
MIKAIAIAAVVLLASVLLYAATRPDDFSVERSTTIQAPPDKVFALINDLRRWEAWSPWEKADPAIQRTYGGAASGKGATYAWAGNKEVGSGSMEIVDTVAPAKVVLKLDFTAPFEAHNMVEFRIEPHAGGVKVTHAMFGPSPFVSKLMGLVFSMDKMVGGKFEEGLANLKALAEK